jgi:hypothetical protein
MTPRVRRVVSGGQTGADRAALDVAAELGIPRGGWCPTGGAAEDHREPPGLLVAYPELQEAPSADPAVRTRLNVQDSDATLVVTDTEPTGGTRLTVRTARRLGRPLLLSDGTDADRVVAWLQAFPDLPVLNVAGPRESTRPGTYARTRALLRTVLATR